MNRRRLLKLLSGAIAAACTAVIVIPGLSYALAAVRRRRSDVTIVQRVARLSDLPVGQPIEAAVTGSRQDAWTLYPEDTIGHVWLVRRTDESTSAEQSKVDAYSAVCPHLRCAVQLDSSGESFVCPCHKAGFDLDGKRVENHELGHKNPAPRGMDVLECRIVRDDESGDWWVEVKYENFKNGSSEKVSMG